MLFWIVIIATFFIPDRSNVSQTELGYLSGTREAFGEYHVNGKGSSYYFELKLKEYSCWFKCSNPYLSEFEFLNLRMRIPKGDSLELGFLPQTFERFKKTDSTELEKHKFRPVTIRTQNEWIGSFNNYVFKERKNQQLVWIIRILWLIVFLFTFLKKISLTELWEKVGFTGLLILFVLFMLFMIIPT